jgi:HK97 family phage prohead protease
MLTKDMKISKDSFTLKDIDMGKREAVIGFASYGKLDREKERANKGMFTKSWNESFEDIRYFFNHKKEMAPGKPLKFWEDDEHAYMQAKHGTHVLGEDTLKMLDEGIIVASSYGFNPIRFTKMATGGYDYKEVQHMETSVLTHWGAHRENVIVGVKKDFDPERLKELNDSEVAFLRRLINNQQQGLMMTVDMSTQAPEGSDMWIYTNELLAEQSRCVAYLKYRLQYGKKEVDDLRAGVKAMEKFVHSTKASDECIQRIEKELQYTKQLLSDIDTAATSAPEQSTQTPTVSKGDNGEFLKQLHYLNLNLKAS